MIRPLFKYALAAVLLLSLPVLPASAQSTKPALPVLTDDETVHQLNNAQRLQWSTAQKQVSDGQAMIDNGKWLQQTKAQLNTPQTGVKEAIESGKQQVADGTALVTQGQQTLAALRLIAQKSYVASQAVAVAGKYQIIVPASQWPDVVQHMSDNLLKALWAANYSQIYLGDVYAFDRGHYVAKSALTDSLRSALIQTDGDHKTLTPDGGLKITRNGAALALDFTGRASTAASAPAAGIVGEILFEPDSGYAYFSLRGVDLSTGKIIHNELTLLSVEPSLGKGLDLVAYQVPSQRIAPPANATVANDSGTAIITLQDNAGLIGTFKSAAHPYVFRADSAGSSDTLENRVALLLVKSLLTQKSPLTITDYDFLVEALPAGSTSDRSALPANVNTTWIVSNLRNLDPSSITLALKARSLTSNVEASAGKFTIETSLKPLTPPSPDELTAAGYQLTPPNPQNQYTDGGQGASAGGMSGGAPVTPPPSSAVKHSP